MANTTPISQELPWTFGVEIEMLFVLDTKRVSANPEYHYILPDHFIEGEVGIPSTCLIVA